MSKYIAVIITQDPTSLNEIREDEVKKGLRTNFYRMPTQFEKFYLPYYPKRASEETMKALRLASIIS